MSPELDCIKKFAHWPGGMCPDRIADPTASQHLWGSHDVIGHVTI